MSLSRLSVPTIIFTQEQVVVEITSRKFPHIDAWGSFLTLMLWQQREESRRKGWWSADTEPGKIIRTVAITCRVRWRRASKRCDGYRRKAQCTFFRFYDHGNELRYFPHLTVRCLKQIGRFKKKISGLFVGVKFGQHNELMGDSIWVVQFASSWFRAMRSRENLISMVSIIAHAFRSFCPLFWQTWCNGPKCFTTGKVS